MRTVLIDWYAEELIKSLGRPRAFEGEGALHASYKGHAYTAMLHIIKKQIHLDLGLTLAKVNSGGPEDTMGWIHKPAPMPVYGSEEFKNTQLTVYLRKKFLAEAPFEVLGYAMVHLLTTIVVESVGNPLARDIAAVDVAGIILGFGPLFKRGVEGHSATHLSSHKVHIRTFRSKALSAKEVEYTLELLQKLKEKEKPPV